MIEHWLLPDSKKRPHDYVLEFLSQWSFLLFLFLFISQWNVGLFANAGILLAEKQVREEVRIWLNFIPLASLITLASNWPTFSFKFDPSPSKYERGYCLRRIENIFFLFSGELNPKTANIAVSHCWYLPMYSTETHLNWWILKSRQLCRSVFE